MRSYWCFLFLIIFGLGSCAAPVRVEDVEGKTVSKVIIRYVGPKHVEEKRLRTYIGTTTGSRYETERTDDDIKALYESGLVNDVRVLAEPKRRGVEVIFEVTARARMGPVLCVGNTAFSDQRLAKQAGFRIGQKLDRPKIMAAARKVEAYYHANGYSEARVSVLFEKDFGINPDAIFQFLVEEGHVSDQ
jgi:outer membrane protein insertion porin family